MAIVQYVLYQLVTWRDEKESKLELCSYKIDILLRNVIEVCSLGSTHTKIYCYSMLQMGIYVT